MLGALLRLLDLGDDEVAARVVSSLEAIVIRPIPAIWCEQLNRCGRP